MLKLAEVDRLVDRAANSALNGVKLRKVFSEPSMDGFGQEALSVTLVIQPDEEHRMTGDKALDVIVSIQRDLQNSGEDRFAFVEFATQEELDLSDDT